MSISQKYSNSYPSLYLNFAQSGQLDPRVSIARTSTGTYVDAEGIVRTAGPNEPRFNYENGECKGLLVEGQKTNSYLYNGGASQYQYRFINNEVGVWQNALGVSSDNTAFNGSSATVTTDLPGGIIGTAARATLTGSNGNASFQFDGIGYNVSVLSTFIRANKNCTIGWGTENNFLYFDLIANEWKRVYAFLSSTPWSSAVRLMRANNRVSNIDGGYPVTFDFSFVQQEEGSSLTSYIPTSGSAVTRAPDKVTINDLSWFDDYEGTFIVDTNLTGVSTTTTLFSVDNGSSQILYNGSKVKVGTGKTLYNPTISSDDTQRIVGYSSSKNIVVSSSSKESAFFSTTTSLPTGMNRLAIGWDPLNSNNYLNGPIKSLRYYPTLLDDTQLKSLSRINQDQEIYETLPTYESNVGIATTGLVLLLDVGVSTSYVGTGVTWYDLSGNNNNGTLTNGVGYGSTQGGYLTFDGSDDYIINSSTTGIPTGNSDRTIQIWVRPTTDTNNFIQLGTGGGGNQVYVFEYYNVSGTIYLFTDGINGENNLVISGSELPTLNTWNHLVFGNSGQNWFYYVNGVQKKSGTWSVTINTVGQKYIIGKRDDVSANTVNGNISHVSIYNRALSATEILQNYNATRSRFTTGTVNNYLTSKIVSDSLALNLDASNPNSYSGEGNIWYDLSGNGNHATMYGIVPFQTDIASCFDFSTAGGTASYNSSMGFTFSSNMVQTTGNFTFSCWIKNPNTTSGQIGLFSNAGGANGYRFGVGLNGIYYLIGPTYTEGGITFSSRLSSSLWYNVSAVYSRTTAQVLLYLNGVYQNFVSIPASQTEMQNGAPGIVSSACCNLYTGKLSSFSVYNKALTSAEVLQNYNAVKDRFGI